MTTPPLDRNSIRRLDALNLVEAFASKDAAAREQVLSVYAQASINDHGISCYELAYCCAHLASMLLEFTHNGDGLLAMCRQRLLGDN